MIAISPNPIPHGHAQFTGDVRIRQAIAFQHRQKGFKQPAPIAGLVLLAEFGQRRLEHRQRPPAFVDALGRHGIGRLVSQPLFGRGEVEREHFVPAAPFPGGLLAPLVGQEMIERREQKRSQLAALPVGQVKDVVVQQVREERLSKVLGVAGVLPTPADLGIQRIPVDLAECPQRRLCGRCLIVAGRRDQAPVRRRETCRAIRSIATGRRAGEIGVMLRHRWRLTAYAVERARDTISHPCACFSPSSCLPRFVR